MTVLELQAFGDDYDPNVPSTADERVEGDGVAGGRVDAADDPRQLLPKARDLLRQEVDAHRQSPQRDLEAARRSLSLLQSKLRRGADAPR